MNDKYLQYSLSDFLEDDDFISMVKEGTLPYDDWKKSLTHHPETQDAFEKARLLIQHLNFEEDRISGDHVNDLWEKISSNTQNKGGNKKVIWLRVAALSGVAAVLLVLIMWMGSFISKHKQISTFAGENITYSLPDESIIQLNSVSYVHYNPKQFEKERILEMEGEVRFEVQKGGDFRVKTEMGEVRVLGTVFNVYHRKSLFEVKCYEGKVQVITSSMDTVVLRANDAVRFNGQGEGTQKFVLEEKDLKDWSDGQFRYEKAPLNRVFEEMERQFNVGIEVEDEKLLKDRFYTGVFRNEDIEEALHAVCWPLHLEYEINGQLVLIRQP